MVRKEKVKREVVDVFLELICFLNFLFFSCFLYGGVMSKIDFDKMFFLFKNKKLDICN